MTDHRTSAEIEREVERDRASLAGTLDELKDKISIDSIVQRGMAELREHGGDIGASVSRAAKDNPVALALTGIGLAWMIFGNPAADRSRRDGRREEFGRQDQGRYGLSGGYDSRPGPGRNMITDDSGPAWARMPHEDHDSDSAGMTDRARAAYSSASDKVSDTAQSLRSGMQGTADTVRDRAASLRERLMQGTEDLTEEGRARVLAARERAHEARQSASAGLRKGTDRATDLFEEQPLIAGALALAVGAALGAALPRTRFEDEHYGAQSDALIDEAERIYAEERAKLGAVASAAMNEARDVAQELRSDVESAAQEVKQDADRSAPSGNAVQDAGQTIKERAQDAGQRIAGAARDEAEEQKLGTPRS